MQYLAARNVIGWTVLFLTGIVTTRLLSPQVYEFTVIASKLPRYVPVWEFVPTLSGVVGTSLLAPSLWSWEWSGRRAALRWRAAVTALLALLLPASMAWIAHLWLPTGARWWDIGWNVFLLTGVGMLATAWLGHVWGPVLGLGVYLAVLAFQQGAPNWAKYIPVSGGYENLDAHIGAALLVGASAVAVWTVSLGRTPLANKLMS